MELLAGAAVGQAVSVVYKGFSTLITDSLEFEPRLKQLTENLNSLEPMTKQNGGPGLAEERDKFKTVWEKGSALVNKLSKVREWSFFKAYYTNKLVELDNDLKRQLMILLGRQAWDREAVSDVAIESTAAPVNPDQQVLLLNRQAHEVPKPPSYCVGLGGPLRDLKVKLLIGDEVSMLSVTGPGDSGKTALARMFYHDQHVKDKFNNRIFFANVSVKPDIDGLGKSLQEFLNQFTEDKPALLILDDVWPHTSGTLLEELCAFSEGSVYKVLVTSRTLPTFGVPYPLNPLTTDDAILLLKASSSLRDDQCYIPQTLLKKIVKHCNRSPLIITEVGKSLIRARIETWEAKVAELTRNPFIPHNKTAGLFDCLQRSLDVLGQDEDKIKECFIDLASFPEDQGIHAGVLIDIWAELYGLHDDAWFIDKLWRLNDDNLANLVDTRMERSYGDCCYSKHFVTQHSKLRKLALYLIRQNSAGETKRLNIDICEDNYQLYPEQKNMMPKEIDLLSITTEGVFSSKWDNMNLPKAKVLVLNFQTEKYALPKFINNMSKSLKVLVVTNYGSFPVELHNFKLVGSLPNLKRLRLERIAISSTSLTKKKKVKSLEKISLYMCNIGKAFSDKSIQFFEALPNLVEINIDFCNDLEILPANLCTRSRPIKKLIITNCHKLSALPEEIGDLLCLEILRVRSCTGLERLPDSITRLKKLHFLDLFDCSEFEELPEGIGEISSLTKVNMQLCDKLKDLPPSVSKLEQLEVICDEAIKGVWRQCLPRVTFRPAVNIREKHGLEWLK